MTRRVLVTGANGYIGRHVVRELVEEGARVIAAGRGGVRGNDFDGKVTYVDVDVLSEDAAARPEFAEVDTLIHLAWQDGFALASSVHPLSVSAHYRFLSEAAANGVGTVACMGTVHEVGYWEGAVDADTPSRPVNLYGVAKTALRESLLRTFAGSDTTIQWLRCYYIVGDDEYSKSVFGKILRAAREGDVTFPFTSGKNMYDFIRVEDLARMIVSLTKLDADGIFECSTGRPTSLADAAEAFIEENGLTIKLNYGAFADRPFDSPGIWGDPARASAALASVSAAPEGQGYVQD